MKYLTFQIVTENMLKENAMGVFFIDIPNWTDPEGKWVNVDFFHSKEEALEFVKNAFGADEEGKISLLRYSEDVDNDWRNTAKSAIDELLSGATVDDAKQVAILDGFECCHIIDIEDTIFGALEHLYDELDPKEVFESTMIDDWIIDALEKFEEKFKCIPSLESAETQK